MISRLVSRSLPAACIAILALCRPICVHAAAFNINPVKFQLNSTRAVAVIQISNPTDEPVRLQINVFDWSTDGRREVLADTDDLLVNPPIFLLPPNKTQYVRFGLRSASAEEPGMERSYRLMVEEVPTEAPVNGIRTLLRFSLPVFFSPKEKEEHIEWKLRKEDQQLTLVAINNGNIHAKINTLILTEDGNKSSVKMTTPSYVLPGQRKEWPLEPLHTSSRKFRLKIQTDDGEKEEILFQGTD